MPLDSSQSIPYKRARFSCDLPTDRLYSASHFWLQEIENGLWRVGFTKFATRMLGEIVDFQLDIQPNDPVSIGKIIGQIEALKAVSDIYCIVEGTFHCKNAALDKDVSIISSNPFGRGWLYQAQGKPDSNRMDANGYISLLDRTIDRLQERETL